MLNHQEKQEDEANHCPNQRTLVSDHPQQQGNEDEEQDKTNSGIFSPRLPSPRRRTSGNGGGDHSILLTPLLPPVGGGGLQRQHEEQEEAVDGESLCSEENKTYSIITSVLPPAGGLLVLLERPDDESRIENLIEVLDEVLVMLGIDGNEEFSFQDVPVIGSSNQTNPPQ